VRNSDFSPDGRWLAVITQSFPEDQRDPSPDDTPQARIHLIDVAAGEIRETLIAPPGFVTCACFSPDGRTLATSGRGKVLLWDLTGLK
jgi:WD40 repeat protein